MGRFHTVDPLTEKNHIQSPYAYAANNPVTLIDWMGLDPRWNGEYGDDAAYYDDETGDEVGWSYVSDWIDEEGAVDWGLYKDEDEGWYYENEDGEFDNSNYSFAHGIDMGLRFAEFGFGKIENRRYSRTYLIGEDDFIQVFNKNSPLTKSEQSEYFDNYLVKKVNNTAKVVGPLVFGLPATLIGGVEAPLAMIKYGPEIWSGMGSTAKVIGGYGARGYLGGQRASYQAGVWLNHTTIGGWFGAFGAAAAPYGTHIPYNVHPIKQVVAYPLVNAAESFFNNKSK